MNSLDIKKEFFRTFSNVKNIADNDPNIMGYIDDYSTGDLTMNECVEMIIVNLDLRLKGLQDMFVNS